MNISLSALIAVAPGLFALSCGGGGAGSATGFIAAYCDLFKPCCAMAKLPANGQQCRAFLGAFASSAKYDAQAGQACLDGLQAASGTATFCAEGAQDETCEKVFAGMARGSKAPGETCAMDGECASAAAGKVECRSAFSAGTEIRKCQVQLRGKEGETPCAGTVDGGVTSYVSSGADVPSQAYLCHGADGLRCDFTTKICVKYKVMGQMCRSSSDCVETTYCDGATGTCAARKAIGGACTSGVFNSRECVAGTYCTTTTKICAAQLGDGATCTNSDECKSSDCVNGKCEGDAPSNLGLSLLCGSA